MTTTYIDIASGETCIEATESTVLYPAPQPFVFDDGHFAVMPRLATWAEEDAVTSSRRSRFQIGIPSRGVQIDGQCSDRILACRFEHLRAKKT